MLLVFASDFHLCNLAFLKRMLAIFSHKFPNLKTQYDAKSCIFICNLITVSSLPFYDVNIIIEKFVVHRSFVIQFLHRYLQRAFATVETSEVALETRVLATHNSIAHIALIYMFHALIFSGVTHWLPNARKWEKKKYFSRRSLSCCRLTK